MRDPIPHRVARPANRQLRVRLSRPGGRVRREPSNPRAAGKSASRPRSSWRRQNRSQTTRRAPPDYSEGSGLEPVAAPATTRGCPT